MRSRQRRQRGRSKDLTQRAQALSQIYRPLHCVRLSRGIPGALWAAIAETVVGCLGKAVGLVSPARLLTDCPGHRAF